MSALVQLVGVSKTFGDAAAVHAVDLSVERGKTTVLIGPSGCGKSTLLRLIIGLLGPDSGEIQFDGTQLRPDKIDIVRHRAGYVIQEGGLFPHLTARGNILLMARHLHRRENEMRARLSELRALTRFPENLLDRYPRELSGAQRQRVSLVRAALHTDLTEIFARLRQTALLVTHDLAEAAYLGDELVLMNEGRIVQQGSIVDLRERPASSFVSEFINAQRGLAMT